MQSESLERSRQTSGAPHLLSVLLMLYNGFPPVRRPLLKALTACTLVCGVHRYWYHPKVKGVYGSGARELEVEPEPEPS